MIGLMFYGAILLWLAFAVFWALKLPKWLRIKKYPKPWSILFGVLIFFLPVTDEIIAYPQYVALCKQAEDNFWYDSAAKGRVLEKTSCSNMSRKNVVIGLNIEAIIEEQGACLLDDGLPVIRWTFVRFSSGMLNFPAGSSGESMPLLLPERCPSRSALSERIQFTENLLRLTRAK
ncbi:hypothetical protein [Hydrogenophaga electricum]|uniref:Uncharacterized protein n=1 Tax=Hydrogenophaga electricum TaxID=1230953 RepID=A0ABQ6BZE9_9BURK|nr:hypothetical protein [Hydrogenophaga electricum]GLS13351.1 hypothetical protein GCM10007935_07800 [Hydrogenophaga electricum]